MTEVSLIDSFLQKGLKEQWVDGVEFRLNGKPIEESSHIADLCNVSYR